MRRLLLPWLVALLTVSVGRAEEQQRGLKVQELLGTDVSIPKYHALVIGINNYQHWQDLRQAREDAEKVGTLLKEKYGFEDVRTIFDQDATRSEITLAMRKLTKEMTAGDSLLIYFAGHGYYDKLLKQGYWVTTEAREEIQGEPATTDWFHNQTLRDFLGRMEARHVLVVSDSCFSGAMFRGSRIDLSDKKNTWYRRAIQQPARWCIASGDLETVPDQSVFARKFSQALTYPRSTIFAASDLAGWLKTEVAELTGNQPVFGPLETTSGSDLGEFIFIPRDAAVTPPAGTPKEPAETTSQEPRVVALTGNLRVDCLSDGKLRVGDRDHDVARGKAYTFSLAAGTYNLVLTGADGVWSQSVEVAPSAEVKVTAQVPARAPVQGAVRVRVSLGPGTLPQERAPTEVELRVGAQAWKRVTLPHLEDKLAAGNYELAVRVDGYNPPSPHTVSVKPGLTADVSFQLAPLPGHIRIASNVATAKVYENGRLLGAVGIDLQLSPFEQHRLEVKADGYVPKYTSVRLPRPGMTYDEVRVDLETAQGYFNVTLSPSTATLLLDGRSISPGLVSVTPGQSHVVRASLAGYTTFEDSYRVNVGATLRVNIVLKTVAPPREEEPQTKRRPGRPVMP